MSPSDDPGDRPPPYNPRPRDIVIEIPGERSTNTKLLLGGLAGAAAVLGGIGLYYHLDSRSAAKNLEAGEHAGQPWTADSIGEQDRAERSARRAGIFYGVGGAFLLGAAIAWIATDPKTETSVIRTTRPTALLAPAPGGAVVGGAWRF